MINKVSRVLLSMQRYSWEQGVAAQAFFESGDTATAILLARDAVQRQGADGRLALMGDHEGSTDPAANGEALIFAARNTREPALQAALDNMLSYLLQRAPRAADGTLFHVVDARQVWIDSMFMAPPFLAAAGEIDEALRQIEGIRRRLWNSQSRLYAHIWDEEAGALKRAAHWGVGNGWAAAGITRVIRALPDTRAGDRQILASHVREILDGCLACHRPDGLFHDVVDDAGTFVETNLAQMLAYTIYRGVRAGWLGHEYLSHANQMRSAAYRMMDGSGYVRGVCGAPAFESSGTAPEGQAFFMLMEAAWQELQK